MNLVDAQTMNGYAYANNSPASYWDGTGLSYCTPADGICLSGNTATVVYKKPNGNGGNQHWNYSRKSGWRKITENRYRYQSNGSYRTQRYTSSGGWGGWKTVTPAGAVARNPVNYTNSPETEALNDANWFSQAGDWMSNAWDSSTGWVDDNWDTIYGVATVVGLGICVFTTAGPVWSLVVFCWLEIWRQISAEIGKTLVKFLGSIMLQTLPSWGREVCLAGVSREVLRGSGNTSDNLESVITKGAPQGVNPGVDIGSTVFVYGVNATQ